MVKRIRGGGGTATAINGGYKFTGSSAIDVFNRFSNAYNSRNEYDEWSFSVGQNRQGNIGYWQPFDLPNYQAGNGLMEGITKGTRFVNLGNQTAQNSDGDGPWAAAFLTVGVLAADDVTGIGVIDDIAIPVVLAGAAIYDATQRIYLTYTLTNSRGATYSGRTSGFGDPYTIMMARYNGHHMAMQGYSNPKLDVAVQGIQGYPAIRGREQQLIDYYGGVGDSRVGNSIRGVAYYNPAGRIYYAASNLYFGPLAAYNGL